MDLPKSQIELLQSLLKENDPSQSEQAGSSFVHELPNENDPYLASIDNSNRPPPAMRVDEVMPYISKQSNGGAPTATEKAPVDRNAIWQDDEVPEVTIPLTFLEQDSRETPEYDVLYGQKVGSHDVYLGLDFEKDPSTQCADSLSIKIKLPKECDMSQVNLDITALSVALTSSN